MIFFEGHIQSVRENYFSIDLKYLMSGTVRKNNSVFESRSDEI